MLTSSTLGAGDHWQRSHGGNTPVRTETPAPARRTHAIGGPMSGTASASGPPLAVACARSSMSPTAFRSAAAG
jgi:hypothetical protein